MEETNNLQNTPEEVLPHPENAATDVETNAVSAAVEAAETPIATPETAETPVVEAPEGPSNAEQPAAPEAAEEPATPEAEAEPEPDYSACTREELVEAMKELMGQDIQKIRNRVAAIRTRFNELNREVQNAAFEKFIAEGGNKDDYQYENDAVAEEMHRLHDQYRAARQKYLDDLEQQKKQNLEAKQALIEEIICIGAFFWMHLTVLNDFIDIFEYTKWILAFLDFFGINISKEATLCTGMTSYADLANFSKQGIEVAICFQTLYILVMSTGLTFYP